MGSAFILSPALKKETIKDTGKTHSCNDNSYIILAKTKQMTTSSYTIYVNGSTANILYNKANNSIVADPKQPPIIETCGGCHNPSGDIAPGWLDTDAETAYE